MRFLLIISLLLLCCHTGFAQAAENAESSADTEKQTSEAIAQAEQEKLVSPIGAMVRSAVFPGWGQVYSRGYFRGGLTFLGIGGSALGALLAQNSFNNRYNAYATYASENPDDEQGVLEIYDRANQRYKLRMFFMYTGIGIWVYSLIDAYVGANFYNANTLIQSIEQDARDIENLGVQIETTPSRLYVGIVKTF